MVSFREKNVFAFIIIYTVHFCDGLDWKSIKCSGEDAMPVPKGGGGVPLSRFPWIGIFQHSFYIAEKIQFAVTSGVLIHPGYALAAAEDIGKIPAEQFSNNTKFIIWGSKGEKYALDVYDYILHPDYQEKRTFATVAIVQLHQWASSRKYPPVNPICLPHRGSGTFDNLYVVKLTDESKTMQKEILEVNYVANKDCAEFYYRAELSYERMAPKYPLCTTVRDQSSSCLWDAGALLVTRLNSAYWTLLGFGMRGPGCAAPTRFASMHKLLEWIDLTILSHPLEKVPPGQTAFFLRQTSPISLALYYAYTSIPQEYGQCERGKRGGVMFKDNTEILTNRNIAAGFYFVSVDSVSQFTCAIMRLDTFMRSFTAFWVENNCYNEGGGKAPGIQAMNKKKLECFVYFKTTAFIEFRFLYSFKAILSTTIYGIRQPAFKIDPWPDKQTTENWWPTDNVMKWAYFKPYYWSMWD